MLIFFSHKNISVKRFSPVLIRCGAERGKVHFKGKKHVEILIAISYYLATAISVGFLEVSFE